MLIKEIRALQTPDILAKLDEAREEQFKLRFQFRGGQLTDYTRLSAGRRELGDAVQALCFLAGANSIFYGDKLLVTGNPDVEADRALLAEQGLRTRDGLAA